MASLSMTPESKVRIVIGVVLTLSGLVLGVIIGYFSAKSIYTREPERTMAACGSGFLFYHPTVKSNLDSCVNTCRSSACVAQTCQIPEPRSYLAYHLQGKMITVDGRINEDAWNEVPWTENFVDIRGDGYPTPRFDTRAKIRWDDDKVYVAAYIQDDDIWANKTEHDSQVWRDNAFEIFFDVDGSTQNYKHIMTNAMQTTRDVNSPKADGRPLVDWESNAQLAVYTDGAINDPTTPSTYWSLELVLPFSQLQLTTRQVGSGTPADSEIWRITLARSEWSSKVVNGRYQKVKGQGADWWSWNAHGAVDLHLPAKWGLLQFSRAAVNSKNFTVDEQWRVSQVLFDTYNALKIFQIEHSKLTKDLKLLDLPQYIRSGLCVGMPQIYLRSWGIFIISVASKDGTISGNIRDDQYVWFGDRSDGTYINTIVRRNTTPSDPLDAK